VESLNVWNHIVFDYFVIVFSVSFCCFVYEKLQFGSFTKFYFFVPCCLIWSSDPIVQVAHQLKHHYNKSIVKTVESVFIIYQNKFQYFNACMCFKLLSLKVFESACKVFPDTKLHDSLPYNLLSFWLTSHCQQFLDGNCSFDRCTSTKVVVNVLNKNNLLTK